MGDLLQALTLWAVWLLAVVGIAGCAVALVVNLARWAVYVWQDRGLPRG